MQLKQFRPYAALFAVAISMSAHAQTLKPGDPAPPLMVSKWIKGSPVVLHDGATFVIDFWSPTAPECSRTIPGLSELARAYHGKVGFVGVAIQTLDVSKVTAYVAKLGDAMDYPVAIDRSPHAGQPTSAQVWMDAAGMGAPRFIPTSFVVGADKRILWIGSTFDLSSVLGKVLAPSWDVRLFAKIFRAQQERMNKQFVLRHDPNLKRLADAKASMDAKNFRLAIHQLNEILATKNLKSQVAAGVVLPLRFSAYRSLNDIDGYYADSLRTSVAWNHDPHVLNALAWDILDPKTQLRVKKYPLALGFAKRATTLSKRQNPNMLDTLAWAYWKTGNRSAALATERAALAIAKAPDKTDMALTLTKFSSLQPQSYPR